MRIYEILRFDRKEIYCEENDKIASPIASPEILFITF